MRSPPEARRERRIYDRERARLRRDAGEAGAPCGICRGTIDYSLSGRHPAGFTAHHVRPKAFGGTTEDGLVPAHSSCNKAVREGRRKMRTKGDRSAEW